LYAKDSWAFSLLACSSLAISPNEDSFDDASLCYPAWVLRADILAFARRDWRAIAASKKQRWERQKASMTPAEALRVGDDLRNYVISLHGGWPTEEDRRNDLAVHIRVSGSLRRVNPARRQ
jgi:hypothetical protein